MILLMKLIGTTELVVWNEEIEDIMKVVKSLLESGLLMKGVCQTIENKSK